MSLYHMQFRFLALFNLLLLVSLCRGEALLVPGEYHSIQFAIDAAVEGDEVVVSHGTYFERLNFSGKHIVVRSEDPSSTATVAATIVDAERLGSVVTFAGTEGTTATLAGLTLTNGYADYGGGIIGNGTLATIRNCRIVSNEARRWGGGIFDCDGLIEGNWIEGNDAVGGGGVSDSDGMVKDNDVRQNTTSRNNFFDDQLNGAGIYFSHGVIEGNRIVGNVVGSHPYDIRGGGGIGFCNAIIKNNIIDGNDGAVMGGGIFYVAGSIIGNRITGNIRGCITTFLGDCRNNVISGNRGGYGVAVSGGSGNFTNNIVIYNIAHGSRPPGVPEGSLGIFDFADDMEIANCVITSNIADGSLVFSPFGDGPTTITNSIIWNNVNYYTGAPLQLGDTHSTPTASLIQGMNDPANGVFSKDPRFVDPENGDFHLQPGSPCIDAGWWFEGIELMDFDGNPRPFRAIEWEERGDGSGVDIGAFEFPRQIPLPNGWVAEGEP